MWTQDLKFHSIHFVSFHSIYWECDLLYWPPTWYFLCYIHISFLAKKFFLNCSFWNYFLLESIYKKEWKLALHFISYKLFLAHDIAFIKTSGKIYYYWKILSLRHVYLVPVSRCFLCKYNWLREHQRAPGEFNYIKQEFCVKYIKKKVALLLNKLLLRYKALLEMELWTEIWLHGRWISLPTQWMNEALMFRSENQIIIFLIKLLNS